MSQMGGVNILDAISPSAAANAREGATASADRGARQQLADQQSLNEGIHTFVDSILTATKMAQEQRMHEQQLASQERQTQAKIASDEKIETGRVQMEQQQLEFQKQTQAWQQSMQQWQARQQTALSNLTLDLENAPSEAGIGRYLGPTDPTTSPSSPQAGSGVVAPGESPMGATGGALAGAPPASEWHAPELMTPETAAEHASAYNEAVFHATKVAAANAISQQLAQAQNSAATNEEKMKSIRTLIEPGMRSLADGHAAYELVKTNTDARLDPVLKNINRAMTDRDESTETGRVLAAIDSARAGVAATAAGPAYSGVASLIGTIPGFSGLAQAAGSVAANLGDSASRKVKDTLGIPTAYNKELDQSIGRTLTPAYLKDVATQMLPGQDELSGRLTSVMAATIKLGQHNTGIDKVSPQEKLELEAKVRNGMRELSNSGISHEEVDHMLEKISTGAGITKFAGSEDKTYTGEIAKHLESQLSNLSSTFRGVMGGLPVGAKLGDMGANMATISFVLDGGIDKSQIPAYINTMEGVSEPAKRALVKKISEYYDNPDVKAAVGSRSEVKKLRGEQATAIAEADKAGVAAKAAEARKQIDMAARMREIRNRHMQKYRDAVQQLGPPPPPPQMQGAQPQPQQRGPVQ